MEPGPSQVTGNGDHPLVRLGEHHGEVGHRGGFPFPLERAGDGQDSGPFGPGQELQVRSQGPVGLGRGAVGFSDQDQVGVLATSPVGDLGDGGQDGCAEAPLQVCAAVQPGVEAVAHQRGRHAEQQTHRDGEDRILHMVRAGRCGWDGGDLDDLATALLQTVGVAQAREGLLEESDPRFEGAPVALQRRRPGGALRPRQARGDRLLLIVQDRDAFLEVVGLQLELGYRLGSPELQVGVRERVGHLCGLLRICRRVADLQDLGARLERHGDMLQELGGRQRGMNVLPDHIGDRGGCRESSLGVQVDREQRLGRVARRADQDLGYRLVRGFLAEGKEQAESHDQGCDPQDQPSLSPDDHKIVHETLRRAVPCPQVVVIHRSILVSVCASAAW